ncbi:Threonine--tRNA ligase of chloroplastic/mitochondrial 2 [Spatholobus suberectus]|nr:Threonine--tRNA ligase of chloroplastic/mitochondrial 2 [Spatholobus suberectus]
MAAFAVATILSPSSIAPLKARRRFGFGSFLTPTTRPRCPSITTTTTATTLAVATHPSVSVNPNPNPNQLVLPSNESSERLLRIRHTCAHVMAMAVQKLYPDAKVTIGPWIESGFYYDFDMEPLTDKDLKRIKKEMDRIVGRNLPLVREEVSRDEAHRRILALNEPYKLEILESIKEDPITIYHIGSVLALFSFYHFNSLMLKLRERGRETIQGKGMVTVCT